MIDCADLTLLAAVAFAYERPGRDPPSSLRRPGSPTLCSMVDHLTSLLYVLLPWNCKTGLSGTCLTGDREFESRSLQRRVRYRRERGHLCLSSAGRRAAASSANSPILTMSGVL